MLRRDDGGDGDICGLDLEALFFQNEALTRDKVLRFFFVASESRVSMEFGMTMEATSAMEYRFRCCLCMMKNEMRKLSNLILVSFSFSCRLAHTVDLEGDTVAIDRVLA